MSETISQQEQLTDQERFENAIEIFIALSHDYTELVRQIQELREALDQDEHRSALQRINPSIPINEQPVDLARSALALYIVKTKEDQLLSKKHDLPAEGARLTHGFTGKKVKITRINPDSPHIGTSKMNNYGHLDGLSRWHDEVKGKIDMLVLEPGSGGWLQVRRGSKYYSTGPLLDQENGYSPNYRVTFL